MKEMLVLSVLRCREKWIVGSGQAENYFLQGTKLSKKSDEECKR